MASNHVVKVRREVIAEIMTCPICRRLFRDPTTVSECLHTFCRKCIHKKLSDEELENCPVCDIDLGCSPLEKLRPDHNLQDVRAKIFPFRRKEKAPEAPSSVTPVRRKERSLSSLVVDTPRVSPQTSRTGKRTKATPRKASSLRGPSFHLEKPDKDDEDSAEDLPESFSSPETSNKLTSNHRQVKNCSNAETSSHPDPKHGAESGAEPGEPKVDLWKPLNYLVEVANRSKSPTNASQGSAAKSEPCQTPNYELHIPRTKVKEHGTKCKVQEKKDDSDIVSPDGDKTKKLRRVRRKKAASYGDYVISPQAVLDASIGNGRKRSGPIWFSLVASEEQEGDAQLPQISATYLRINDVTMPVSVIQKYLVNKLDLANESEVELKCLGQSVIPTLQLNSLVELWLQSTTPSQRMPALIGSSAKDFVMVLVYARKCTSP